MKWDQLKEWGVNLHDINAGMERNDGKLAAYRTGTTDVRDGVAGKESVDVLVTPGEIPAASMTTDGLTKGAGRSAEDMSWKRARGASGQLSVDGFRLAMSAFEQIDGVSIFSNPKIIVANEKEAVVDMTTKLPNVSMTTSRTGVQNDQLDISARLEVIPGDKGDRDGKGRGLFAGEAFFSWGISVKVTPRVSPAG